MPPAAAQIVLKASHQFPGLAVARRSAYANFATKVPGGDDLIRKALSVD